MPDATNQPSDFSLLLENFTHGQKADVLKCLANLSNEEVFTPPDVANQMLDLLPNELWSDPNATFLDPASKSGVFLREIAKRLIEGLKEWQPDLKKRLEHIFKKQLFALSITELTGLISRRSVYCSKCANSKWSVVTFVKEDGNIHFHTIQHEWVSGRCKHCGASQQEYERDASLETHAYEFIHPNWDKEFRNMRFDVIISNPPYQLSTGGAKAQAIPLYDAFVEKAISLRPRYVSMIIPDRWFSGGFGLDKFRDFMLSNKGISNIYDYAIAQDCFPNVDVPGGICYFLWERDNQYEKCNYEIQFNGKTSKAERPLLEENMDVFVKYVEGNSILKKVMDNEAFHTFMDLVSSQRPFGLPTNFDSFEEKETNSVSVYYRNQQIGYLSRERIPQNVDMIDKWKLFASRSYGERISSNLFVTGKPFMGKPGTACTETYITVGPFKNEAEANNAIAYMSTKFFRFLVLMHKPTQDLLRKVYAFVPIQDFSKAWTDSELYEKYKLSEDEIAFIESMIRPME